MTDNDRKKREDELDSFWDLSSIIPPKKNISNTGRDVRREPSVAIVSDEKATNQKSTVSDSPITKKSTVITRYVNPRAEAEKKNKPSPESEYSMDNSLIHKVEIYKWRNQYNYYDAFDRLAHKYQDLAPTGKILDEVAFFSYIPHYGHMSHSQLDWYVFWRERVRHGDYLKTGYSYVLLYAYELLALSDVLTAESVRDKLCGIWLNYRSDYPQLDKFMGDWICDFSLIHRLPPPRLPSEVFESIMQNCTLKEYYIPFCGKDYRLYADVITRYCSSYDYKKSKFYDNEDNKKIYDTYIVGAIEYVMSRYSDAGRIFSGIGLTDSHIGKDTFVGAICTERIKKRLEVDFCSFSRTNDLRYAVGSMIKHCENRVRAYLGIKSRFGAIGLHTGIRACIDEYFDTHLCGTFKAQSAVKEIPEYEKQYDVPKIPFSLEKAMEIEQSSWETTGLLIDAFGSEEDEDGLQPPPLDTEEFVKPLDDECDALLSSDAVGFLKVCLESEGNTVKEKAFAASKGKLCDSLAEEINGYALEIIEDIILEDNGSGGYSVISDYLEQAAEIASAVKA